MMSTSANVSKQDDEKLINRFLSVIQTKNKEYFFDAMRATAFDVSELSWYVIHDFCDNLSDNCISNENLSKLDDIIRNNVTRLLKLPTSEDKLILYKALDLIRKVDGLLTKEDTTLFNYIYLQKLSLQIVAKLMYTKVKTKLSKNKWKNFLSDAKDAITFYITYYVNKLKQNLDSLKSSRLTNWVVDFYTCKMLNTYNINLIAVKDNILHLNKIPIITNESKTVGVTSIEFFEEILNFYQKAINTNYKIFELKNFKRNKDIFIVPSMNFGYLGQYFSPIYSLISKIFLPDKIAPALVTVKKLVIMIAPISL